MPDDVVAELDRWRTTTRTAENAHEFVSMNELLRRARAEIVRLRVQLEAVAPLRIAIADALAAARREGAAEMRERAAAALDEDAPWAAHAIRSLPLTPEER